MEFCARLPAGSGRVPGETGGTTDNLIRIGHLCHLTERRQRAGKVPATARIGNPEGWTEPDLVWPLTSAGAWLTLTGA